MLTKTDLEKYGKVELCEEKDGKFHILITEGFVNNAMDVFKLMQLIETKTNKEYPYIDKFFADANKFHYIIKK